MATKWRVYYDGADEVIMLLTPDEFARLPIGTVLVNIFGEEKTKGTDYIDSDTRAGHLAYGLTEPDVRKYESYLGGGIWGRIPEPANRF